MEKFPYIVVTFPSVHHALKLESRAKNLNLSLKLIPVPREISSSCGIAAKIDQDELKNTELLMDEHGIEYDGIYLYETPNSKPIKIKSFDED